MESLPDDVALVLLRGIGRYIREAPTSDLPLPVRRFKGFRERALAPHRDTLLSILDEDATRALILQWLDDDKPSLPKDVEEALRTAARRPDGWEEALTARSSDDGGAGEGGTDRIAKLEGALAKEKARTAKAKDDLKAEREQSGRVVTDERAAKTKLQQTVEEMEVALADALRRAEGSEAELARERDRAARELRRARRDAEKAEQRVVELEAELKRARSAIPTEPADGQDPEVKAPPPPKRATRKPRSGPRRALRVPKGLLADDPVALDRWLGRDDVHLLVDGYNVTKAESGFGDLSLEAQRDRLITELNNLALRKKIEVTIVFDGAEVTRPKTRRARIRTIFTAENEIADDVIVELLGKMPPVPVVVVTNDKELQERASALGATIATSGQLLSLLR